MSILCFPTSFCLFGSLVLGFLVVFVLVLLSEGILVSCFLGVHSYCQLILLYTCRSYIFYFNKWSKSSLHALFVFHASFFCGFRFDFFSTCRVTFGSPGCKHDSFHLIFTTASVSDCLTSSTTFPWHQTYILSHSSSILTQHVDSPWRRLQFTAVKNLPSKLLQLTQLVTDTLLFQTFSLFVSIYS